MQHTMDHMASEMRIYDSANRRLYINGAERERLLTTLNTAPEPIRVFGLLLIYTGCRLSEARELKPSSVQRLGRVVAFRTLKKRRQNHIREVPIPAQFAEDLNVFLAKIPAGSFVWSHDGKMVNRATAYRWVKRAMSKAEISGAQACPKGLRHGYGIHAVRTGVQLNMLSKWMGHASINTTSIYANAVGAEELEMADRMWQ